MKRLAEFVVEAHGSYQLHINLMTDQTEVFIKLRGRAARVAWATLFVEDGASASGRRWLRHAHPGGGAIHHWRAFVACHAC